MKKNVIMAIIAGVVLIALCVGGYFLHERNEANREALRRDKEGLEKVREIANERNKGFNTSELPDDSPLKIGVARVSAESKTEE